MGMMPWRRALSLGAAVAVAVIGIGAQPVPAAAPSDEALFAARDGYTVVRVDPQTGTETTLLDLSNTGVFALRLFADERQPVLYELGGICVCGKGGGPELERVYTIDTVSGSYSATPELNISLLPWAFGFDPSSHKLYGAATLPPAFNTTALVQVDTSTGAESVVAQIPAPVWLVMAIAVDPSSDTVFLSYLPGPGSPAILLIIDPRTGETKGKATLSDIVETLAFDRVGHQLLGVASQNLVRVDATTGAEMVIASVPQGSFPPSLAVIPNSRELLAAEAGFPDRLVTVDLKTGAVTPGPSVGGKLTSLVFQNLRGNGG